MKVRMLLITVAWVPLSFFSTAHAATYYVSQSSGSDANTGLSHAQAWKTLSKVNATVTGTSSDVYFLAGDSWYGRLVIDWPGTSSDRVVAGSYFMSNGVEKKGVPKGGNKPEIRGSYPNIGNANSVPSDIWAPLISLNDNYITVQNISVYGSAGFGISLGNGYNNAIIENNDIDYSNGSSIFLARKTSNSIVRNNHSSRCAWSEIDKIKLWNTHPGCIIGANTHDNLFENNTLVNSAGEGIIFYETSYNNIIRRNTITSHKFAAIYLDNAHNNIIEENIVLGDPAGVHKQNFSSISVAIEEHYQTLSDSTGNIIRNNLIAGVPLCFSTDIQAGAQAKGKKIGVKFLGNTCVGTVMAIKMYDKASDYTDVEIANNIFWDQDTGANACTVPQGSNITLHHNSWGAKQANLDCSATGDLIGNPDLQSNADFRLFGDINMPGVADFQPEIGSVVYGAGVAHVSLTKDYQGTIRPPLPSLGALEAESVVSPSAPANFMVR